MKYQRKSFQVPATTPTKTPCAIHHFVRGKCLRCDQKVVTPITQADIDELRAKRHAKYGESVPTDSEGAE